MLSKVTIKNFLSIKNEQTIKIDKDITSVIGKNESGKSTILKAINKLNGLKIETDEKNVELKSQESYIKGLFILDKEKIDIINKGYEEDNELGFYSLPSERENLYYEITIKDIDNTKYYTLYYLDEQKNYVPISEDIYLERIVEYIKSIGKKFRLDNEQEEALAKTYNLSEEGIKNYIDSNLIKLSFPKEVIDELKKVS